MNQSEQSVVTLTRQLEAEKKKSHEKELENTRLQNMVATRELPPHHLILPSPLFRYNSLTRLIPTPVVEKADSEKQQRDSSQHQKEDETSRTQQLERLGQDVIELQEALAKVLSLSLIF